METPTTTPSLQLKASLDEARSMIKLHFKVAGKKVGRPPIGVESINRAAIIFMCGAFEAFIEDTASQAFEHIVTSAKDTNKIPLTIRKKISKAVCENTHELSAWQMVGDGWKEIAREYHRTVVRERLGYFNTPKTSRIDELFFELIGIKDISSTWSWKGQAQINAKEKLDKFIKLRGSIAHGEKPRAVVHKKDVLDYYSFLAPLSVRISNEVTDYCNKISGDYPWGLTKYGAIS